MSSAEDSREDREEWLSNKDTKDTNKNVRTKLEESAGIVARSLFTRAMTVLILIFFPRKDGRI